MISEEELEKILRAHGYRASVVPHFPGCYEIHVECAIRWLVQTVRDLSPEAAKRLETISLAEETREKELLKLLEYFLDMLRITSMNTSKAYLEAHRLVRLAKGLPAEDQIFPGAPRKKKKKQGPDLEDRSNQLD